MKRATRVILGADNPGKWIPNGRQTNFGAISETIHIPISIYIYTYMHVIICVTNVFSLTKYGKHEQLSFLTITSSETLFTSGRQTRFLTS